MIKYSLKETYNLENNIDSIYKELLENKYNFSILKTSNKYMCLTKEKSLFPIDELNDFIEKYKNNEYYKSIKENIAEVDKNDLKKYYSYLNKFKYKLTKNLYGDKYFFGCVSIRSKTGFITTIRGKENLNDYSYVNYVDHTNKIVSIKDKKATLNAPLLAYLFENNNVDAIVHINHEYNEDFPTYEYAFPGTINDSIRDNHKSFNIKYHGVFYLINKDGSVIK